MTRRLRSTFMSFESDSPYCFCAYSITRCATRDSRSGRRLLPLRLALASRLMLAARRFIDPCSRNEAMTAKASVVAARKISSVTIVDAASPNMSKAASIVQILKLTMRYMMKTPTIAQAAAAPSPILVAPKCQTLR